MPGEANTSRSPPLLDFASFYDSDLAKKQKLVSEVRDCCLHNGFFQITNHPVPIQLQERVMAWNKRFFDLPLEEKKKVGKGKKNDSGASKQGPMNADGSDCTNSGGKSGAL